MGQTGGGWEGEGRGEGRREVAGAELNILGDSSGLRGCLTIWGLVDGPGRGLAEVRGRGGVEWWGEGMRAGRHIGSSE